MIAIYSLLHREILRFYRQKGRVIGSLGTPLMLWLFLASGLSAIVPTPQLPQSAGFSTYFFPGIVLLTVLFTSIFSSISLIEDREQGFLQGVLVSPASPSVIVTGKILGGALLAFLQGLFLLVLAPLVGYSFSGEVFLKAVSILALLSLGLSSLGFLFAWKFNSVQSFHSIMNLVLFPMWLLSGAFFPESGAPFWLKPLMWLNPLSYGLSALKLSLSNTEGPYFFNAAITLLFGVLCFGISVRLVKQRNEET